MKRRRKVDVDDLLPLLRRKILDRRDELNAGVVNENVDRSEFALGVAYHVRDVLGARHIGRRVKARHVEVLLYPGALSLDVCCIAEAVDNDIGA